MTTTNQTVQSVLTAAKQPDAQDNETKKKTTTRQIPTKTNISYSHAVSRSVVAPTALRNINLVWTQRETAVICNLLRKDDLCSDIPLEFMAMKGRQNMSIKCPDSASAETVTIALNKKYINAIHVKQINRNRPQVTITRLFTDTPKRKRFLHKYAIKIPR